MGGQVLTQKYDKSTCKKVVEDLHIEKNKFMIKQFSVLSHELRTPLNIIYSTVQLLESCYKENTNMHEAKMFFKYYDIMKQNCHRLTKLINNIVDMNKIDLGLVNVHLGNNNIVNIVENITLSVVGYAKLKNISAVFDTEVEEKTILCDSDKIEKIMLNLLSNSIKFTKPGNDNVKIEFSDLNL